MNVPFVDLKIQYRTIRNEIVKAIEEVLENASFIEGPVVKAFTENFAKLHNAKYCLGTSSGTSALHVALWALGVDSGDEVIVPVNTFIATAEAVSLTGATPVFVDHYPQNFTIDVSKIEEKLTENTKAIIPVHLYGQPADMDPILTIAEKHNLLIIEDCAQAHLSEYKGNPVGTFGQVGCFSFYPGKNLGAYGEGGAILTNDATLYEKMKMIHDHGSNKKYYHDMLGHNYRMHGFQGAVLNIKLQYLKQWIEMRRRNASVYRKKLKGVEGIECFEEMNYAKHVYHLFVVLAEKRDELQKFLMENDIATGLHYPIPLHMQKAYEFLNYGKNTFPVTMEYKDKILSLPMYPELTEDQIDFVVSKINEFYRRT